MLNIKLFRKKYIASICGHKTLVKGPFTAFGEEFFIRMPRQELEGPDYCLDCIGKMSIKCSSCDKIILIGHRVFESFDGKERFITCSDEDCLGSKRGSPGMWVPSGSIRINGIVKHGDFR
jgi:hypothetical protein